MPNVWCQEDRLGFLARVIQRWACVRGPLAIVVVTAVTTCASCEVSFVKAAGQSSAMQLVALNATNGDVEWQESLTGDLQYEGAAVGSRLVFTTVRHCTVIELRNRAAALEVQTGSRRWQSSSGMVLSSDAAQGVVVASGSRITGLDATTGQEVWALPFEFLPADKGAAGPTLVFAKQNNVAGSFEAFDRKKGFLQWTYTLNTGEATIPLVRVVFSNREVTIVALGGSELHGGSDTKTTFVVLDTASGHEETRFDALDPELWSSDVAVADGEVVMLDNGQLVSHDLTSGAVRWTRNAPAGQPPEGVPPATLRASTDQREAFLEAPSNNGATVRAVDMTTGATRWLSKLGYVIVSTGKRTILGTAQGELTSLHAVTGKVEWNSTSSVVVPRVDRNRYAALTDGRLVLSRAAGAQCAAE